MRIGLVCEGQTDIPVFEALLNKLLPDDWVLIPLQPERDALGNYGSAGWTKVRDLCQSYGSYVTHLPNGPDILIVQVDGDVAGQVSAATLDELCAHIRSWLGSGATHPGLVITIPAQATETWLLAGSRPASPALESVRKPAEQLIRAGLIAHDKHGNPIKDQQRYRELAAPLADRLASLRPVLRELDRFCSKVEALVRRC
ncbi:MAG: hypothetical protein R6X02_04930 [Enhygromyxa sp.]